VEEVLYGELDKIEERHGQSIKFWDDLGVYGPAMGLIGTLIGLVQMLQQMDDPTAIGPAMAVALLTTFYGSIIANMIGIPLANKLKMKSQQEIADKTLVAQGLLSILAGENPRFMVERLNATLAPDQRWEEAA
jgi:chemotaxis protein MotA